MDNLTDEEKKVLVNVLHCRTFQNLIGAEEWELTEDEEMVLWGIIGKTKA